MYKKFTRYFPFLIEFYVLTPVPAVLHIITKTGRNKGYEYGETGRNKGYEYGETGRKKEYEYGETARR